ncbi:hypothetical protein K501DRAFT_281439 [Backusella circina FSU 941]|nr:hypothetical protein K501DRAFT_281439 [Backusella circina FSU 941]
MVQNSHSLGPCNFQNDIYPPPLCQNTCLEWVDDVDRITSDPKICSNTSLRNKTLEYYTEQCTSWQGVNGTIEQNCISGLANEPFYCGFQDEYLACSYCKHHSSDTCCIIVDCKRPLTAGMIIGIIISSLIMTALFLFTFFCLCSRRTSTPPLDPFGCSATSQDNILKQQSTTTTTTTSPNVSPMIHREKSSRSFIANRQDSMTSQKTTVINNNYTNNNNNDQNIYLVNYAYQSQMPDEIQLDHGDIICVAVTFDDGWGVGFNITTGQKGAIPMVCISRVPEEELNQLSEEINTISSTS